jgi:hypothetical protein
METVQLEDIRQIGMLVVVGVLFIMILASIRVAKEHERFAILFLGRFFMLKGPGLVICLPFVQKAIRLTIGDKGKYKGDEIAEYFGYGLPVMANSTLGINAPIIIKSFNNGQVHVEPA